MESAHGDSKALPNLAPKGAQGEVVLAFPLQGTTYKILHLIRHGQATSNAAAEGAADHAAYKSLSSLGEKQAKDLRAKLSGSLKPELIVVSPLTRAIQTAQGVFGTHHKFIVHDFTRERMGVHPCDKRHTVTELKEKFKDIDFSLVTADDDVQWKLEERETNESLDGRVRGFLQWIRARKETEIAVVAHSGYFDHMMNSVLKTSDPALRKWFENCELRSMHLLFSADEAIAAPKAT